MHVALFPVIGNIGLTVTTTLALHPPPIAYVMRAVPPATPVTTPELLTVAIAVLLLVHVPPEMLSNSGRVLPAQTGVFPVIAGNPDNTVSVFVAKQPEESAYVIAVVPAAIPVTIPVPAIVATVGLLLAHVPPEVAFVRAVVPLMQNDAGPAIAAGAAFMVMALVT
jgi:hypothetical protein